MAGDSGWWAENINEPQGCHASLYLPDDYDCPADCSVLCAKYDTLPVLGKHIIRTEAFIIEDLDDFFSKFFEEDCFLVGVLDVSANLTH